MMSAAYVLTPLGTLELRAKEGNLVWCKFTEKPADDENVQEDVLAQARRELHEYFAKQRTEFSVPLGFHGSDFCVGVWKQLTTVGFGKTATYSDIAKLIGRPMAARAVGTACGKNPLWIFVPCHRIVQNSGGLGGYAGGLWRKRKLLGLEGKRRFAWDGLVD